MSMSPERDEELRLARQGRDPVVARIVQKLYGEPELTGIQLDWDLATISAVALVIGDVVDDYRSSTLPGLRGAVSSEDIPLLEQALRDLESVVES
jgi:hypothetical protein